MQLNLGAFFAALPWFAPQKTGLFGAPLRQALLASSGPACGVAKPLLSLALLKNGLHSIFELNAAPTKTYQPLIDHLNGLPPADGWFTEHYGGTGLKKPWQKKNTRRLDAIREEIDRLQLDEVTKAVAITSLILALDRVDNTLGHFASYLNEWSPVCGSTKNKIPP
jgi:hypothetical protein